MDEPTANAKIPEHDRLAQVISRTLEDAGGEPDEGELDQVFERIRERINKSSALTVRRIAPHPEFTTPVVSNRIAREKATADLLRLRKWVLRAWIAAAIAIVAAAGVTMYCSLRFGRTSERIAAVSAATQTHAAPTGSATDVAAARTTATDSVQPVLPNGADRGLWNAVPKGTKGSGSVTGAGVSATRPEQSPEHTDGVSTQPAGNSAPADPTPRANASIPPSANISDIAPSSSIAPTAAPSAPEISASAKEVPPTIGTELITIIVNGYPVVGFQVLPADDFDFKLKLNASGEIITFRWSSLEDSERRRVKKLYGMGEPENRPVFGEKVTGQRLHLVSGRTLDALPLPERDTPGQRAFRTANAPLLMIPSAEIASSDPLPGYESDFYTRQELYEGWLLALPPGPDANAYMDLARKCAALGLFSEALDSVKSAEAIDHRLVEVNHDFRATLQADLARQQTQDLLGNLMRACGSKDYFGAAEILGKLDRNFPHSELKSRWDSVRGEVEKGVRLELRRKVTELSYSVAQELLRRQLTRRVKVDDKGNLVPSIPGKQVITKDGHPFKGTLQPSDVPGLLTLKVSTNVGEMLLSISENDVASIEDIDLSVSTKEVLQSFDDLREYAGNPQNPTGLRTQMIAAIARKLSGVGVTEREVAALFDQRLTQEARYEDGKLVRNPGFASIQDAAYGRGSWLREGAKPAPLVPDDPDAAEEPHNSRGEAYAKPPSSESAETSNDPNVWWRTQDFETQFSILRAIAGEKVFRGKVADVACKDCGGAGTVQSIGLGGHATTVRCPVCRGLGVLYKVTYK